MQVIYSSNLSDWSFLDLHISWNAKEATESIQDLGSSYHPNCAEIQNKGSPFQFTWWRALSIPSLVQHWGFHPYARGRYLSSPMVGTIQPSGPIYRLMHMLDKRLDILHATINLALSQITNIFQCVGELESCTNACETDLLAPCQSTAQQDVLICQLQDWWSWK